MTGDFIKALVNASNLNNYYSDSVNTNFIVEGKQIVCSFGGNPDVENYAQEVGNEMIELLIGSEELAGRLCDLGSLPFNLNGAEHIYDKDRRVKALKFDVTPEIEGNCKLLFAMAFMKFVGNKMKKGFEENPKATEAQIRMIHAFVRSITVGRMGEPINDLYSVGLDGVKSADPLMNKALKGIYVQTLETELKNCGVNSSEFFELNDNVLSIKDITNARVVNNIAAHTAERIALHFAKQGNKSSKVKNITDVFRREIFQLTTVNGKNGILIDGYDCDVFTDEDARDAGNDFALILKIEVSAEDVRDITREEADRINAAFRKKGFDDILVDIRGKTEKTQFTKSQKPVYGISNKQFALLIPELMKSPIAYNEASKCFEYAMNLGNLCKSREHSNLSDDLGRILSHGYPGEKGLSEASSYIWQCLLKSDFGHNGYDEPELAEFVDEKIEEWRIVGKNNDKNRVIPQWKVRNAPPSSLGVGRAIGGSRGSLSSDCSSNSSRSVSPMPRNSSDSSLSSQGGSESAAAAHKRSGVMPPLDEMSGEYGQSSEKYGKCSSVEVVSGPSSQQKSHDSRNTRNKKTSTKLKNTKLTALLQEAQKNCSIM